MNQDLEPQYQEQWIACKFTVSPKASTCKFVCYDTIDISTVRSTTLAYANLPLEERQKHTIDQVDKRYLDMTLAAAILTCGSNIKPMVAVVDSQVCPFPRLSGILAIDILSRTLLTPFNDSSELHGTDRTELYAKYHHLKSLVLKHLIPSNWNTLSWPTGPGSSV